MNPGGDGNLQHVLNLSELLYATRQQTCKIELRHYVRCGLVDMTWPDGYPILSSVRLRDLLHHQPHQGMLSWKGDSACSQDTVRPLDGEELHDGVPNPAGEEGWIPVTSLLLQHEAGVVSEVVEDEEVKICNKTIGLSVILLKRLTKVEPSVLIYEKPPESIRNMGISVWTGKQLLTREEALHRSVSGDVLHVDCEDLDLVTDVGVDEVTGGVVRQVQLGADHDQGHLEAGPPGC